jgi:hypothetical protein
MTYDLEWRGYIITFNCLLGIIEGDDTQLYHIIWLFT